jgi:hypothetical protein
MGWDYSGLLVFHFSGYGISSGMLMIAFIFGIGMALYNSKNFIAQGCCSM